MASGNGPQAGGNGDSELDASRAALAAAGSHYDGLVSRTLNRRVSRPVARWLAPTPLTPNGATGITTLVAIAAALATAFGWNIAGGIGIQMASIIDGVDGELARLKNMSTRFGAVLDAVSDRYADAFMLGGMTVYAARFEDVARPEFVGMLALAGSLSVSYSRARIEASLKRGPSDGLFGLASRDVRLLIAAVGTVLGFCYATLIVLAVISWATVLFRLIILRR